MIAADSEGPLEVAVKMIAAPVWVPIYFAYLGCRKVASAWPKRHVKTEPEILPPTRQTWEPRTELERTVAAALLLAGEPVNNLKLAALMGVSPGESSRRVAQLAGVLKRAQDRRFPFAAPGRQLSGQAADFDAATSKALNAARFNSSVSLSPDATAVIMRLAMRT